MVIYFYPRASSENQGQSVGSGERARRKFSSTGERALGYRLSPNYFQNFKQMPAADRAQKMLCIIVPNWRTVSPAFFSWVRTRRLLSCHTCPAFGMLSAGAIQFAREYSVFDSSQIIVNNTRKIKMRRRRESQISNSLTRQNNNVARASHFFVRFFAVNCTTTHENA